MLDFKFVFVGDMEIRTINECFYQIRNGANVKQGIVNGGFPITRIESIANDRFHRDRLGYAGITDISKYESYVLEDGDLLMSHINSLQYLGRTVLYKRQDDEIIIHGMNLLGLKANRELINPEYARYYFYSQKFRDQISKIAKKSVNQASFSISDLKRITLQIHPINEQEHIVGILNKIQTVIDYKRKQMDLLDNLVKSRFIELFGFPVSNSKKWKTEKMKDIAPAVSYSGDFKESVWLLNLDMVEAQTGRIIDYLYVSECEVGNSTCSFDTSNVLYSKLRPYLNKVVIPDRCGYATSEMIPLKPNHLKLERTYLAFMLRSDEFVNMINEKVAGAKMPRVSMEDFRGFDVPVPPKELQKQFATFVERVDKTKFSYSFF